MRLLLVLAAFAAVALITASCGQASSPPERQEKQAGVEEAKEKPEQKPEPTTEKTATEAMSTAEADAAKAAAAEEEITLEELNKIDTRTAYGEQLVLGLASCQIVKYRAENGVQAWREWRKRFMDEVAKAPADDVPSIQEEMLKMGYSCTVAEAREYAAP